MAAGPVVVKKHCANHDFVICLRDAATAARPKPSSYLFQRKVRPRRRSHFGIPNERSGSTNEAGAKRNAYGICALNQFNIAF